VTSLTICDDLVDPVASQLDYAILLRLKTFIFVWLLIVEYNLWTKFRESSLRLFLIVEIVIN
jgi:hypothetical protein